MEFVSSWQLGLAVGGAVLAVTWYRNRQSSAYPLPPGPRKLPIIGNLLDMPPSYPWKVYADWGKKYGSDILHLNAAGQSIIVLNSYEVAKELLDKRSAIYSSRPRSTMITELSGFGFQFGLMPYGEPWRIRRRLFKKYFNASDPLIHQVQETKYIHRLLHQLLEDPSDFLELVGHMTGSITLSMTYGVDILPKNDPNIEVAHLATRAVSESLGTGSRLVDVISVLKYIPVWFPGASFQRIAARSRDQAKRLREGIFEEARKKWSTRAMSNPCFVSLCLENCHDENDSEHMTILKDVAGMVYMAAAESTTGVIKLFILAMVCFPEVQKRAQQELDSVLNGARLPTHADKDSLPYVTAIMKEVLRWKAIVPTGVAHQSTAADVFKGYYIPENSIVIPNVWAMFHNESDYPDPEEFRPERYLSSEGELRTDNDIRDPTDVVFGFGRRICPGAHIASSTLWLTAASILTVFDIKKALDDSGQLIEPRCEFPSTLVSPPLPFQCSITPRSRNASTLIQEVYETTASDNT